MVSDFSFRSELDVVNEQLSKEIRFKTATFKKLVTVDLDDLDRITCPAIVLAASKASGVITQNSLDMAIIFQFTYLADKIHHLITDNEDLPEDRRQFPVLVGDFLYGKFFWYLSRANLLPYLNSIAQVIERMSEGMIMRWQMKEQELNYDDIFRIYDKERGSLTALGARVGAELCEAPEEFKNQCEKFGRLIGIAWASSNDAFNKEFTENILFQAKTTLDILNLDFNVDPLYEVYYFMLHQLGRVYE